MMAWLLGVIGLAAVIYAVKYYLLRANLKKAEQELMEIKQNPEENRILLFSHASKEAEKLFLYMNEYILQSRKQQRDAATQEKRLRAQIENISHDLRTPLTAILGYLELMDREGLSKEDRESLEIVERKARSLQRLIGNFYDLSRLEVDDYQLHPEPVELTRFTRETMLGYFQEFENRHLAVDLKLPEKQSVISLDAAALERIFANLVQNALRYAQTYFQVSVTEIDGQVRITFENDAEGLKKEDAERLFERFYVHDSSRTAQSTGLGLAISKLLAEAMGGEAEAEICGNVLKISFVFPASKKGDY